MSVFKSRVIRYFLGKTVSLLNISQVVVTVGIKNSDNLKMTVIVSLSTQFPVSKTFKTVTRTSLVVLKIEKRNSATMETDVTKY